MEYTEYFIDKTLINHQLIVLEKLDGFDVLKKNTDISVVVVTDGKSYTFNDCHIDDTEDRRLRLPFSVISWIKDNFPVSIAYFFSNADKKSPGVWRKSDIKAFYDARNSQNKKMDIPAETLYVALTPDKKGLIIREGFKITCSNAQRYLSAKALCSILPYIVNGVKNASLKDASASESKSYIIDQTTKWLSVSEYCATPFSHPGLYILRRTDANGEYVYYVGKADNIQARVIENKGTLSHIEDKLITDKQYDEIACISIRFDSILRAYNALSEENKTAVANPPVSKGSAADNALYAIEDIAIHVVAMIMLSEGKKLDNKQYREYTSEHIFKSGLS